MLGISHRALALAPMSVSVHLKALCPANTALENTEMNE